MITSTRVGSLGTGGGEKASRRGLERGHDSDWKRDYDSRAGVQVSRV